MGNPTRRKPVRTGLVTSTVEVDGRRVSYASGGRGLPVLFLHGWGLDHETYRRSLHRLTARGCRVIAPSLPGFGRSDELPVARRTLAGYARWVPRFLDAVGADEPMVVLGHSFGGGVATRFAYDCPDGVRYLVVLNSVGSPRASAAAGVAARSPLLGLNGMRSMVNALRPAEDLTTTTLMQWRLLSNFQRAPWSVMQTAQAALWADLRKEMAALAARQLPVLVLWSDDDRVVPLDSFDTFCSTFGTDGQMVRGGHSWLLADPEAFGEVLDNVISVQGGEHGASAATGSIAQLRALLAETTLPRVVAAELLDGVSPLWVMSEPTELLAADLALCHPRVAAGEVRAVARALPDGNAFRLTVVARDRRGFLADTAAVLSAAGVTIETASVMTWPRRELALHALTVRSDGDMDAARWATIGERLRAAVDVPFSSKFTPSGRATVTRSGAGVGTTIVRVTAPDDVGLLSAICRWFADEGRSIEAAGIATADGVASDVFVVDGDCDTDRLARHLSRAPSSSGSCGRLLRALLATAPR